MGNEEIMDDDVADYNEQIIDDDVSSDSNDDLTYDEFDTKHSEDAEVVRLWLDADPYINKLRLALENKYIHEERIVEGDEEKIVKTLKQIPDTLPLANAKGVSQILAIFSGLVSKDIVQANIDEKQYNFFMYDFTINFTRTLVINRTGDDGWGITRNDLRTVRKIVTNAISLYLTRPIRDKERDRFKNKPNSENKSDGFMDKMAKTYFKSKGRAL